MKIVSSLLLGLICFQLFACSTNEIGQTNNSDITTNTDTLKMKITIGSTVFTATLNSSATATAFKAMLPMTIIMTELNRNEKYFDLANGLPTNPSNPGSIQNGDLMIYGSNTLVLFYKTFSTSYSYTHLGRIDDTAGLVAALGAGSVTVKMELSN